MLTSDSVKAIYSSGIIKKKHKNRVIPQRYTDGYKKEVVAQVYKSNNLKAVARANNVPQSSLSRWCEEFKQNGK